MTRDTGNFRVVNEIDRIRTARGFRNAGVGVIDISIFIEHHVLKYGTEAQCLKDIRLIFGREVDRLRVAAAFDIEDAVIRPDVLIVAYKMTLRVRRQCGFPSATETEEQRR